MFTKELSVFKSVKKHDSKYNAKDKNERIVDK